MTLGFNLGLFAIGSFLLTTILDRIFSRRRFVKYILAIILAIITIYNFATMNRGTNNGFEDLGKFVLGIFFFTASASSLITAAAYDLYRKFRNKKRPM